MFTNKRFLPAWTPIPSQQDSVFQVVLPEDGELDPISQRSLFNLKSMIPTFRRWDRLGETVQVRSWSQARTRKTMRKKMIVIVSLSTNMLW